MNTELSTLVHNLVLDNSIPAKDLAKAIGKPYSTLLREVNPYDTGAKLGAETLLQLMLQTGDIKPLEFMVQKLGYRLSGAQNEVPMVTPGAFQGTAAAHLEGLCPTCGKELPHAPHDFSKAEKHA